MTNAPEFVVDNSMAYTCPNCGNIAELQNMLEVRIGHYAAWGFNTEAMLWALNEIRDDLEAGRLLPKDAAVAVNKFPGLGRIGQLLSKTENVAVAIAILALVHQVIMGAVGGGGQTTVNQSTFEVDNSITVNNYRELSDDEVAEIADAVIERLNDADETGDTPAEPPLR